MKICPKCQKELPEDARYCWFCMEELKEKTRQPEVRFRKKPRFLFLAIVISAILLIALAVVFVGTFVSERTFSKKGAFVFPEISVFITDAVNASETLRADRWLPETISYAGETEGAFRYSSENGFRTAETALFIGTDRKTARFLIGPVRGEEYGDAVAILAAAVSAAFHKYPVGLTERLSFSSESWENEPGDPMKRKQTLRPEGYEESTEIRFVLTVSEGLEWNLSFEIVPVEAS